MSKRHQIDTTAKRLDEFLSWLFSSRSQASLSGGGRTFRRRTSEFWDLWPLPPIVDEVYDVIYVDGIHLGRSCVVLIAQSRTHVLGWYLARRERAIAWQTLLERIAPPLMVVSDGGPGLAKALKQVWPETKVQRCTFHVYCTVRACTTMNPRLEAGKELYALAVQLLKIRDKKGRDAWKTEYKKWLMRWEEFLAQKTRLDDGTQMYTHERLCKARRAVNTLINNETLFAFLDDQWGEQANMPAMNNRIEGGINAQLRLMLRHHRGLRLMRRVKAIFWWCYMHSQNPAPSAQILKIMPTDQDIENIYQRHHMHTQPHATIPQWGDAIVWSELHHTTPYHNTWD